MSRWRAASLHGRHGAGCRCGGRCPSEDRFQASTEGGAALVCGRVPPSPRRCSDGGSLLIAEPNGSRRVGLTEVAVVPIVDTRSAVCGGGMIPSRWTLRCRRDRTTSERSRTREAATYLCGRAMPLARRERCANGAGGPGVVCTDRSESVAASRSRSGRFHYVRGDIGTTRSARTVASPNLVGSRGTSSLRPGCPSVRHVPPSVVARPPAPPPTVAIVAATEGV